MPALRHFLLGCIVGHITIYKQKQIEHHEIKIYKNPNLYGILNISKYQIPEEIDFIFITGIQTIQLHRSIQGLHRQYGGITNNTIETTNLQKCKKNIHNQRK